MAVRVQKVNAWLSTQEPSLKEITLRTRLVELEPPGV